MGTTTNFFAQRQRSWYQQKENFRPALCFQIADRCSDDEEEEKDEDEDEDEDEDKDEDKDEDEAVFIRDSIANEDPPNTHRVQHRPVR